MSNKQQTSYYECKGTTFTITRIDDNQFKAHDPYSDYAFKIKGSEQGFDVWQLNIQNWLEGTRVNRTLDEAMQVAVRFIRKQLDLKEQKASVVRKIDELFEENK